MVNPCLGPLLLGTPGPVGVRSYDEKRCNIHRHSGKADSMPIPFSGAMADAILVGFVHDDKPPSFLLTMFSAEG